MSRPFKSYSGKSAFGQVNEPLEGGEYILNKKAKYTYCSPNICHPNKNVGSESNLLMLKKANTLKFNPFLSNFDKTSLYINLYTKLDLEGVCTISDLSGNCPVAITTTVPYINPTVPNFDKYVIDPSGNLFGNTTCGINNFTNYMVYNKICCNVYNATGFYTITQDSIYNTIITFTGNGTITFCSNISVNYIVVGGGGGGGSGETNPGYATSSGGGGGGGVTYGTKNFSNITYNLLIGSGGIGGSTSGVSGTNGGPSYINNGTTNIVTANYGYGGQTGSSIDNDIGGNGGASGTAGSTGGAGGYANGYQGGLPSGLPGTIGGAGGGACYFDGVGGFGSLNISVPIYGTDFGAGGGGGSYDNIPGQAGNPNAGNGSSPGGTAGNGTANTGGGGGGSGYSNTSAHPGGNGGSGVVILYFNV